MSAGDLSHWLSSRSANLSVKRRTRPPTSHTCTHRAPLTHSLTCTREKNVCRHRHTGTNMEMQASVPSFSLSLSLMSDQEALKRGKGRTREGMKMASSPPLLPPSPLFATETCITKETDGRRERGKRSRVPDEKKRISVSRRAPKKRALLACALGSRVCVCVCPLCLRV